MKAQQVSEVLRSLGYTGKMDPCGFELPPIGSRTEGPCSFSQHGQRVRLINGSGIACDNGSWWLTLVHNGQPLSEKVSTKKELRRVILEWEAGPKPNGALYAKRHRNRFGDHTIWVYPSHRAA